MDTESTSESSRSVFKKHRPSLPDARMPIHLEGEDGREIPPEENRPVSPFSPFPEKLEALETKEVVLVTEYQTALFESRINMELNPTCKWYKNGSEIHIDKRTTILSDGQWQKLYIRRVRLCDHGVYTLECKQFDRHVNIHHRLYVYPRTYSSGVFHLAQKHSKSGVIKHLINTRVRVGKSFVMTAIFAFEPKNDYIWFKNNEMLYHNRRTNMDKHGKKASLSITDANAKDIGIYYVLAITNHGYFSSFAHVVVGTPNEKLPLLPFIEENPPEDVEGYIGEEIRIYAKVQFDTETISRWGRNEAIKVTNDIRQIDFGNNYIGLMIPSPKISSAGTYQLLMANSQIPQVVKASLCLTVNEPPPPHPTEVRVVRKLESVVACCGGSVLFDCSFALEDLVNSYVVWHIGHYTIERTNSLFDVITGCGQFILYIQCVKPCMAGQVICELRRSYPNHSSVKMQRSYANLTCLPPCAMYERPRNALTSKLIISRMHPTISMVSPTYGCRNGSEENPDSRVSDMQRPARSWGTRLLKFCKMGAICGMHRSLSMPLTMPQDDRIDETFYFEIILCKLNNVGLFFLHATTHGRDPYRIDNTVISQCTGEEASTLIKWADLKASNRIDVVYTVKIQLQDRSFACIGLTKRQHLVIYDLPVDRIMVLRISEEQTQLHAEHSDIEIILPPESLHRDRAPTNVLSETAFNAKYLRTDHNIGTGAFGCVALVRDKKDQREYAAKVVKARTGKRRENILREFRIMNKLSHPKIVQLMGFFETPLSFIFVMEYYWGGELFDRVVADEYMKEVDVTEYVYQICEALMYLNNMDIVHLDIKPENIICINPNSTNVKIIDFGVARFLNEGTPRQTYGTREYVAPEILDYEPISTFSDMWSVGVVTYVLLSGLMPFAGNNWMERMINISSAKYDYNDDAFDEVSDLAKNFVDKLLVRKPHRRMSAEQALNHRWLRDGPPRGAGSKRLAKMRKNMKSYLVEYKHHWQFYERLSDLDHDLTDFSQ